MALLLFYGCCAGPEAMLLAHEQRAKLERRESFALLATTSSETWAFAAPASVASALVAHYRPPGAGERIEPPEAAPPELARSLAVARSVLEARGYRPAAEGAQTADLVLLISLSTHPDGRLARAAFHLGGELDQRFRTDLLGVAAVIPDRPDACKVTAEQLVEALVELIPEREPPEQQ